MKKGNKGKPGGFDTTTIYLRPKNNIVVQKTPDNIKCFAGGEWKPPSEFSKRALENHVQSNKSPGQSVVSCRFHSAQIRRELKCNGPCGDWHPIESFSRSTRVNGRNWCHNCTDWQLSVQPGYAPYVPPASYDAGDDSDDDNDDGDDTSSRLIPNSEIPDENIEDWIYNNPSEPGDFEAVEVGTQPSVMDSASSVSGVFGPSLMDSRPRPGEIGGLPGALNAMNLGRVDRTGPARPNYAAAPSVNSASTVRGATGNISAGAGGTGAAAGRAWTGTGPAYSAAGGSLLMSNNGDTASQTNPSVSSMLFSAANSRHIPSSSQGHSMTSGTVAGSDTGWMENRFAPLNNSSALARPTVVSQRPETGNGWARPVQRKTIDIAPRYVANTGGLEVQPQKKVVYADADDDDSEDEC